ncbi:hypothetical protein [Mucilaginibacter myungsuensis]|uniref:Uncharacterized protein n=1 Tax=Mucilaginibacter myungsuensis TaxID=649104 RepID=A0A929L1U0_9SPHI|nr:hypothetical protein [Mucilaginibacter myungsuensis]MBE9664058.1 hypothetical protein [Mucilaginibacter myungsuensis]MDN3601236.1 hypothetical protein [Mucilaginibacter myungsuensis]
MTIAAMRERAHELVDEANDVELVEILAKLEGEKALEWFEDEEFLADLDEQQHRIKSGVDPTIPLNEVNAMFNKLKTQRSQHREL